MQDGDNGLKASRVGSSTSALGSSLSLPSHLWQPYYCLSPYTPNYAFTLSLHYCNMALSLEPQHYSRSRSSPSPVLKIPTLGAGGLGLGLGRGWGHELEELQPVKESLAPFVSWLEPTRLAFN